MLFLFLYMQVSHKQFAIEDITRIDAIEFVAGQGEQTDHFRVALHWNILQRNYRRWQLQASTALSYAKFDNPQRERRASQLKDVGLTPVLKLSPQTRWQHLQPFIEMGIGVHYLSHRDVGVKDFSTNFQFGDHIGFGISFGQKVETTLAYQFQHFSNGGIDAPNPGINLHILSMGMKFKK